jgi:hypothetical protein
MTADRIKRGHILRLSRRRHAWRVLGVEEGKDGRLSFLLTCGKGKPMVRHARPDKAFEEIGWLKGWAAPGKSWNREAVQ